MALLIEINQIELADYWTLHLKMQNGLQMRAWA